MRHDLVIKSGNKDKGESLFRLLFLLASRGTQRLIGLSIVMEVTVDDMVAFSHLTHRDMGNVTMMSGTLLTM